MTGSSGVARILALSIRRVAGAFAGKPQSLGKVADLAEVAEKGPSYEAGRETRDS